MPTDISLSTWQTLLQPEYKDLRHQAEHSDPEAVSSIQRLRKHWPQELVHAALELADARRRAQKKLPDHWQTIVANRPGIEMASSQALSRYKAVRLGTTLSSDQPLHDLCCGIGADAMAFVQAGLSVIGIDHDPVSAWMCAHNAGCSTQACDVRDILESVTAFHLDPSRRAADGSRRMPQLSDMSPSIEFVEELHNLNIPGCTKLAPGISPDDLPTGQVEYISENSTMTQAVLWTTHFAEPGVQATMIHPSRGTHHLTDFFTLPSPPPPPLGPLQRFIHTADPAAERARLLGTLCQVTNTVMPHAALGLFTSDQAVDNPWLTPFEVLDCVPWRQSKVKSLLKELNAGIVEIKTRGRAVDPDQIQRKLRGKGDIPLTIFIHRFDTAVRAIITRRLNQPFGDDQNA